MGPILPLLKELNFNMLSLRELSLYFSSSGVEALSKLSLDIAPATVHAIVGENGAGKTTLARLAAGRIIPQRGELFVDGSPLPLGSVSAARRAGIALVEQNPEMDTKLSLLEDALIGVETRKGPFLSIRKARKNWEEILALTSLNLSPELSVSKASPAERQLSRLIAALMQKPRYLFLDEVSALLDGEEQKKIHNLVRSLSEKGLGVIIVSHRLAEVFSLADKITVLRNGKNMGTFNRGEIDQKEIIARMFGTAEQAETAMQTEASPEKKDSAPLLATEPLLELKNISLKKEPWISLNIKELTLHRGEIVGVLGLRGSGLESLEAFIAGALGSGESYGELTVPKKGELAWISSLPNHTPLPERLTLAESLVLFPDFWDSKSGPKRQSKKRAFWNLRSLVSHFFIPQARVQSIAENIIDRAQIHARAGQAGGTLSGGMKRRFVFMREILRKSKILLAGEPFWGLDRASVEKMSEKLRLYTRHGGGVLLISTDIDLVLDLANTIYILKEGYLSGAFYPENFNSKESARDFLSRYMILGEENA